MAPPGWAVALSVCLFIGMLISLEAGFRIGLRDARRFPELAHEGIGVIEAAVFALLGLLLAFSFAGGTSRLDARRELIVREANAIGTAYLRLDLLPEDARTEERRLFRTYLDARLQFYDTLTEREVAAAELAHITSIQQDIWSRAAAAARADVSGNVARVLLPAINEMIDITTERTIALVTHLPTLIFALLAGIALLSGLLAGYAMSKRKARSLVHTVLYAAIVSLTIYTVLDLEYPRAGFIRVDAADNAMKQLRDSIK